jgi:hypothetical protein
MQIIKTNIDIPIFKITVHNHKIIKPLILKSIKDMGSYSFIDKNQRITNTDWHMGSGLVRLYYEHLGPVMENVCELIKQYFNYKASNIRIFGYWYQQYFKGDYHTWHNHENSNFSCVYYVDLNKNNPKTSFRINKNEFEIEINEGEVLIFPGFLEHTSKENTSDYVKTIISFNLSV